MMLSALASAQISWRSLFDLLLLSFHDVADEPVACAGRTTETHRSRKSMVPHVTPDPHVADATEPHAHLTGGQVARVVGNADGMGEGRMRSVHTSILAASPTAVR
jgi:hypothetical protein